MTTTPTKKPRAARRRRKTTPKPMTEQSYPVTKDEVPAKPTPKLISRSEYITDFNNRMTIHNYEIKELVKDTKWVYQKVKPYALKAIDKGKALYNRLSPKDS